MNEKISQVLNSTSNNKKDARALLKLLMGQKSQSVKTTYPIIERVLKIGRGRLTMAVTQLQDAGILSVKATNECKSNRTHFFIFQLLTGETK